MCKDFAETNQAFIQACERADDARDKKAQKDPIKPTRRQASKFLRGYGMAYKFRQAEPQS